MIQFSKESDERRDAGPLECCCLHGAAGMAADWRGFSKSIAAAGIGTRAIDLWRFLEAGPLSLAGCGRALAEEAGGRVFRGSGRSLLGYSMGGRLALHALLESGHPWQAAVIVSAHPGLETEEEMTARRASDADWASRALAGDWAEFLADWDAQPILGSAPIRDPKAAGGIVMRRREIARSFVDWSLGNQDPLWRRLPEIRIPVLWIVGEKDGKFRTLAERAVALLPDARLAIAPAAGHRVPWEAEAWFAGTVSKFLKSGLV